MGGLSETGPIQEMKNPDAGLWVEMRILCLGFHSTSEVYKLTFTARRKSDLAMVLTIYGIVLVCFCQFKCQIAGFAAKEMQIQII